MQRWGLSSVLARSALVLGVCLSGAAGAQLSHRPDAMFRQGFERVAFGPSNDNDAARFLAQATFGPSLADIAHLRLVGYEAWIDEQFAAAPSTSLPYLDWVEGLSSTPPGNNDVTDNTRMEIWAINALGSPDPSRDNRVPADQLRQRIAFALSEIFVVSAQNATLNYSPWAVVSYQDMLTTNAFGNYRDLLEAVTRHPTMGIYLNMLQNQKADAEQNIHPDENYAREVLQLFSVGLVKLDTDGTPLPGGLPTYTQTTVRGFAAALTGWNWNNAGCGDETYPCCDEETFHYCGPSNPDEPAWFNPMQPVEAYHDRTHDKQLLDYTGVVLPHGVLGRGGNAQVELTAALNNIFLHPNVGPFIGKQLIQRLVTSNPSPAYVRRVTDAFNGTEPGQSGVRGDMKAVIRAILLDPEARYGQYAALDTYGKLREPLLKLTHLWRAMDTRTTSGRVGGLQSYPPIQDWYGQAPYRAPTVFNFFKPDYQHPGEIRTRGLVSPEFQILSDTMVVATPNDLYHNIFCYFVGSTRCWGSDFPDTIQMNIARDAPLAASNPGALLDRYNTLFMSGQMSPFMRDVILTQLNTITQGTHNSSYGRVRAQNALYLIVNSPEYSIQK